MASIGSFMSSPVISTGHDTLGHEAMEIMLENNINSILIQENGEWAGIFTKADWFRKIVRGDGSIISERVHTAMTKTIVTVDKVDSMALASRLMENNRIRHLVVTDKDQIIGVLSSKDLENYYRELHDQEE